MAKSRPSLFLRQTWNGDLNQPKSQEMPIIKLSLESMSQGVPEYLTTDSAKFSGQLLIVPAIDQIPFPIPLNIPLICEFLAHSS